ncbi:hypothetical protein ICW40_00510 [Actinotalea ferrariae]|uniref:hypothetical protein n=1 Tax=Actinotalea ferrariae TaxID=1386098 RepID=UPI001C8CD8BB|nr:hypothetical protein [Actinotalea ferrariae]MBX9243290.1 hypothetical protein [Actinotalea ferrariae]
MSIALLITSASATAAVPQQDATDGVAELIADVAPDQGDVLVGVQNAAGDTTARIGAITVAVPADPTEPVTLSSTGAAALEVSFPAEVDVSAADIAGDGTLVYAGDDATAAAQILDDGSVRLQTVTESAKGPHEFTYSFGDSITPTRSVDGATIELLAGGSPLGQVAPAWAVDANGNAVATSYEIRGNTLVQVIVPNADTTYPVVADPKVSFGLGIYYHYNRAETATIAGYGIGGATAAGAVCATFGGAIGLAVCGSYIAAIIHQAGIAQNSSPKKCLVVRQVTPTLLVPYTYRDSRCV